MTNVETDYHAWREMVVEVAGTTFPAATKPGLLAPGEVDPAISLLTAAVEPIAGDTAVLLNCGGGGGILAAVMAPVASKILITDRNVVAYEASCRTVELNGLANAEVFLGHGTYELPEGTSAGMVAIRIPHEKLALLQLLYDAFSVLAPGGRCYVAGASTEGVKSAARLLEKIYGNVEVLATKAGNRVLLSRKTDEHPAYVDPETAHFLGSDAFNVLNVTLRNEPYQLFTRPGVFSWEHLDEATGVLAEVMEIRPGESVLDLGCGAGALGLVASRLSEGAPVLMVDADVEAVRSARRTAKAAGIWNYQVISSDVASAVHHEPLDVVVTNPPFHVGKTTDLDLPLQFISDAWNVLRPGGRLYLVANRTLPYERAIEAKFRSVKMLEDGRRFKVLTATKV